mmetsp:Transcript_77864/g.202754  ORF Transcript_77864/g.202754 Transcript_77864/m.202754 type:complete len:201 (+) Transcript_77864:202-804(+)
MLRGHSQCHIFLCARVLYKPCDRNLDESWHESRDGCLRGCATQLVAHGVLHLGCHAQWLHDSQEQRVVRLRHVRLGTRGQRLVALGGRPVAFRDILGSLLDSSSVWSAKWDDHELQRSDHPDDSHHRIGYGCGLDPWQIVCSIPLEGMREDPKDEAGETTGAATPEDLRGFEEVDVVAVVSWVLLDWHCLWRLAVQIARN